MVDTTIDGMGAYGALVGTEQVEVQGAANGPSGKTTTQAIADLGGAGGSGFPIAVQALVTGAAPVNIDPTALKAYQITTGGTAGVEVVHIPDQALASGINPLFVGARVVFYIVAHTNAADVVHVTIGGTQGVYGADTSFDRQVFNIVSLSAVGEIAAFIWIGNEWAFDYQTAHNGAEYIALPVTIAPPDNLANDTGALTVLVGGKATQAGNDGGSVFIDAGQGAGGSPNGQISIGTGGGPVGALAASVTIGNFDIVIENGQVEMFNLPTADPGIQGALWVDPATHILHVSP